VSVPVSYPGVYIIEEPSAVHTIGGVPTAVAAFVGDAPRGELNVAQHITSWADYERLFEGVDPKASMAPMSHAVYLFFLNGGSAAEIVRAGDENAATTGVIPLSDDLKLEATSPGVWANSLKVRVEQTTGESSLFDLMISSGGVNLERYARLSVANVVAALSGSPLLRVQGSPTKPPQTGFTYSATAAPEQLPTPKRASSASGAGGGGAGGGGAGANDPPNRRQGALTVGAPEIVGSPSAKTGIYALAKADILNMLCLPTDPANTYDADLVLSPAAAFCAERRAMLIVDAPAGWTGAGTSLRSRRPLPFTTVSTSPALTGQSTSYAAVYYPNIVARDPRSGEAVERGACGAVAGIWAATDASRGVWKAPAGTAAGISGITDLSVHIDDGENGVLNPLAVNCLRTMPLVGPVVWGARTLEGADERGSQWKYLPVRRTALFIEESLRRGTQWVVFEPNDEPLWSSIRLNVGAFMNSLFRQGAFQGATPQEAYFVKCDAENNPQNDINRGIVNILVGFAPLKPAEFVIIHIEQLAGQLQV